MTGTPLRFAAPLALLLGLFTIAGCASVDRYGRYGGGGYGRSGEYSRGGYNYPSSARVGNARGAQARYRVCHRGQTKILPAPAVDAHLRHGDRFGYCGNARRGRWERDDDRRRGRDDRRDRRDRRDRDDDDDDDDDRRRRNRGRWG